LYSHVFTAARAELDAWRGAGSPDLSPPFPCGFISLATAAALTCATPLEAEAERRVMEPLGLVRGIDAFVQAVLDERANIVAANPGPGALGANESAVNYINAMVGQWEIASALRALAALPEHGVRLCFLRNVLDDDFLLATDPPWVHEWFLEQRIFSAAGSKHFMQVGADLMTLESWAATVRADATASPPFIVDNQGHYFVARIKASDYVSFAGAHAYVYDSIAHQDGEVLNEHVADVMRVLEECTSAVIVTCETTFKLTPNGTGCECPSDSVAHTHTA
jgi:hypothetical protein